MMKEKKDIGKYFRDRLDESDGIVPETLWDRIDESLEGKKKRKKRFLWLVFSTIGLVIIAVVYFGIPSADSENRTTEMEDPISEEKDTQNSGTDDDDTEGDISETNVDPETKDSEVNNEIVKSTEGSNQKAVLDSFIESETTYYYYRSSDEQKIITTDKSKVDSIINQAKTDTDALKNLFPVKKKDS